MIVDEIVMLLAKVTLWMSALFVTVLLLLLWKYKDELRNMWQSEVFQNNFQSGSVTSPVVIGVDVGSHFEECDQVFLYDISLTLNDQLPTLSSPTINPDEAIVYVAEVESKGVYSHANH